MIRSSARRARGHLATAAILTAALCWCNHIAVRFDQGRPTFAAGGAVVFPVGVIDGAGLILGWWR